MLKGHGSLQRYQLLFLTGRLFVAPSASGQLLKLLRLQSQPLSSFIFIKTITVSFFFPPHLQNILLQECAWEAVLSGELHLHFIIIPDWTTRGNQEKCNLSKAQFKGRLLCMCAWLCRSMGDLCHSNQWLKKKKDSLLSYKNCKLNCTFATQWNAHTCTNYSYFSHRVCMWSML